MRQRMRMGMRLILGLGLGLECSELTAAEVRQGGDLVVEVEETVYRFMSANNGAGPMWCSGSTCLVRVGDLVYASGLETLAEAKPLNNCRWLLFRRDATGWKQVAADKDGRTREPSPLAVVSDGRLYLSVNPTRVEDPTVYAGPARPEVLEFRSEDWGAGFRRLQPSWDGVPPFTEHSYRSFAADGPGRELILFQNIDYTHAEWVFRDQDGRWSACGRLAWPWGADYEKPQPIRVCYPNVALRNRAVFFCGVSDIVEPKSAWREFKRELTGQQWDYDFRRLFFTWTPDVTRTPFREWVEVASRESTCGWVGPGDLWVEEDGAVQVVWTERALDERLRARFFPEAQQRFGLYWARIREGRVEARRTLLEGGEGLASGEVPSAARFHGLPGGRLLVICHVGGRAEDGRALGENRWCELSADGQPGPMRRLALDKPFVSWFTATPRAGSAPSRWLDVLGQRAGEGSTISYARLRWAER